MKNVSSTLKGLALLAFVLGLTSIANAQATRTWVSGVGDDVNPCSRTAPCKTFAGAISKTADGGEIDVLDPGGFGTVTITKSITIDGTTGAGFGSILAAGTTGIFVNDSASGAPNTKVVQLRNLSINGATTGVVGISFISARQLYVENCVVFGFKGSGLNSHGLKIAPTTGTNFNINVKDSIFKNNSGDGILQSAPVGTLNASYDNVALWGNNNGLEATGGTGNISRSVIDNNASNGVTATGGSVVNASSDQVTSNGTGFNCGGGSTIRISDNNVYRNGTGLGGAGTFNSFGNNHILGNTSDGLTPGITNPK
jgi:hypothetical protein